MFDQIHICTILADKGRGHGVNNKSAVYRPSWPDHIWYVYPTVSTNATIESNK